MYTAGESQGPISAHQGSDGLVLQPMRSEIELIMFASGDSPTPNRYTVQAMHNILQHQLAGLLKWLDCLRQRRGATQVELGDVLFALRKNHTKFSRLVKFLTFKDRQNNLAQSVNVDDESISNLVEGSKKSKNRESLIDTFLERFDSTGELKLVCSSSELDRVKRQRLLRDDKRCSILSPELYLQLSQAKQASFTRSQSRFKEWVGSHCANIAVQSYAVEALAFLSSDLIAQLIDNVFTLREIASRNPPLRVADPAKAFPELDTSEAEKRHLERPISSQELRTVMCHYHSQPTLNTAAFHQRPNPDGLFIIT